MENRVELNVGGKVFITTLQTLQSLPDTKLGRLVAKHDWKKKKVLKLFFDRNPKIVNNILDFYRTGELHLPGHVCGAVILRELAFWEIPKRMVHECCWRRVDQHNSDVAIVHEIDRFLHDPYDVRQHGGDQRPLSGWNKIWYAMEHPDYSLAAKLWMVLYFTVVFLAVLWFSLETVPNLREFTELFKWMSARDNQSADQVFLTLDSLQQLYVTQPKPWLRYPQMAMYTFFVLEFFVRLATCPDKKEFLKSARTWLDVILLASAAVYYIVENTVMTKRVDFDDAEFHALLIFYSLTMVKSFRVIYLAKHSDTLKILMLSAKSSLKELALLIVCALTFVTMFGSLAYVADTVTRDHTFHSVPHGMWWAIVTMTTVGYGDIVPVSVYGQLVGAVCVLSGILAMALPFAIVAAKFFSYHDNMAPRKQMRSRLDFQHRNPKFCVKKSKKWSTENDAILYDDLTDEVTTKNDYVTDDGMKDADSDIENVTKMCVSNNSDKKTEAVGKESVVTVSRGGHFEKDGTLASSGTLPGMTTSGTLPVTHKKATNTTV